MKLKEDYMIKQVNLYENDGVRSPRQKMFSLSLSLSRSLPFSVSLSVSLSLSLSLALAGALALSLSVSLSLGRVLALSLSLSRCLSCIALLSCLGIVFACIVLFFISSLCLTHLAQTGKDWTDSHTSSDQNEGRLYETRGEPK